MKLDRTRTIKDIFVMARFWLEHSIHTDVSGTVFMFPVLSWNLSTPTLSGEKIMFYTGDVE
jgi:hypothetical protein